jgi:hypothetical protein
MIKKIGFIIGLLLFFSWVQAFTYQGELSQTGVLYNGDADIRFSLYDAAVNGNEVGLSDLHLQVNVVDGRFMVELDQWIGLYDGAPLWLEIEVDLGLTGTFTTLSPRQKINPVPYAEFAYDGFGSMGDITAVTAGTGLTGGGSSGDVTLHIDASAVQNRVTGSCPAGESIRSIAQNGTVVCETDNDSGGDVTAVTAGSGLTGGGTSGDISLQTDASVVQNRVTGVCPTGQSIRAIDQDGTVTCEIDDNFSGDYADLTAVPWLLNGNDVYSLKDIGIGLVSPLSAFHIKTTGTGIHDGIHLETSLTTNEDWYIYMPASDDLVIRNDANDILTLAKDSGNLGVGTTNPEAKLEVNGQVKIAGGSPGVGKVLTSDASGLASWKDIPANIEVGNYGTVVNPVTGKIWLDRNLGATQVATSSTDTAAYGNLYQWGRAAEGHELRTSAVYNSTSQGQATTWVPDEGSNAWDEKFMHSQVNWLNTNQDDLWKGRSADNNPCPSGFRIPTAAEWNQERRTWASQDEDGAFNSVLKLPAAGIRLWSDGTLSSAGYLGIYWADKAKSNSSAYSIYFNAGSAYMSQGNKSSGYSIRCIKD